MTVRRLRIRLVVATPDGARVLARPAGLAGWRLPAIAVDAPFDGWTDAAHHAVQATLGTTVEPLGALAPDAWLVRATARIPAMGNQWIGRDELDRLGVDAALIRAWTPAPPEA